MSDRKACDVPDVLLERYRLGELTVEEHAALQRRLASDAGAAERLAALASSDREIEARHVPEELAEGVRARLQARTSTRRRSRAVRTASWSAALASAAAVLIVVAHRRPDVDEVARPAHGSAEGTLAGDRVKGLQPSLALYRKTADGSEPIEDGARVHTGDVVRVAYRAAGRGYGTVLSIDGRGVVTLHLPTTGRRAVPLRPGATVLLDRAYELDDAPRFERFYFVVSDQAFALDAVLSAARRRATSPDGRGPAALALPDGFEQSTFLLAKEESR